MNEKLVDFFSGDMWIPENNLHEVQVEFIKKKLNDLHPGKNIEDGLYIKCLEATPERRVIKCHFPLQLMRKDLLEKTKVFFY